MYVIALIGYVVQKMTKEKGGSKTFARELTGLYTKSTLIDSGTFSDLDCYDQPCASEFFTAEDAGRLEGVSSYMLCINEQRAGGESGAAARVHLSAVVRRIDSSMPYA